MCLNLIPGRDIRKVSSDLGCIAVPNDISNADCCLWSIERSVVGLSPEKTFAVWFLLQDFCFEVDLTIEQ